MTLENIFKSYQNQNIAILGLGREGQSTYRLLRHYFPTQSLTLLDQSRQAETEFFKNDENINLVLGEDYLNGLNDFDVIFKSPGVNLHRLDYFLDQNKLTSQIDLFLQVFGHQTIGITGTKGKSTTTVLIYHILKNSGKDTVLAGNIGIPVFDIIGDIKPETQVVCELSAHQLEHIHKAPHIAVLLNFFQEHLDYFPSYSNYKEAKFHITNYQTEEDYLIYNSDNYEIYEMIEQFGFRRNFRSFSHTNRPMDKLYDKENEIFYKIDGCAEHLLTLNQDFLIQGRHNQLNIMAAFLVCQTLGITPEDFVRHLKSFKGLEHRLEKVGSFKGIVFYNDSISTIPEATITAIETLRNVDSLILGGFDRGIDYMPLVQFLKTHPVRNIAFTGKAGERILELLKSEKSLPKHYIYTMNYEEIIDFAFQYGQKGKICLLSPAASSYDQFKNFEYRGNTFKELVKRRGDNL